jgi:ADP-ribosylglycohydrolase
MVNRTLHLARTAVINCEQSSPNSASIVELIGTSRNGRLEYERVTCNQHTPKTPLSAQSSLGAILGACVGDAAGATLEFLGRSPTADEVEQALSMIGGGVFGLAPGQVTDDGELTLSMARALADHENYDVEHVARDYARWAASSPFDMGITTASSIGAGARLLRAADTSADASTDIHLTMRDAAREHGMQSKANGSLMRATPLGVWAHRCSADEIAAYARHDSELSHPNDSCCDAVACYAIAIASLVRDPGDRRRAWKETCDWAEQHAAAEVRQWLAIAEAQEEVPFHPLAGLRQDRLHARLPASPGW